MIIIYSVIVVRFSSAKTDVDAPKPAPGNRTSEQQYLPIEPPRQ